MWEGVGDRTELQYIDPPTLMAISVVSFSFSRACSTGGPEALFAGWWPFFTASYQQLLWTPNRPEGPFSLAWVSLPLLISNLSPTLTVWILFLTELYNSSTPSQSPTWSLEWHVWSSSSRNNCHAVHRSLSSGASVYECTMGILAMSHFVSQFPLTRFPLITAIGMCHFLPLHHFEWHFWPGRRSKIQQNVYTNIFTWSSR